jgi:hypothetical protein
MNNGYQQIPIKILEALNYYNRSDLAGLLEGSCIDFNESSTYGSRYNSYRTVLNIYTDILTHEQLERDSERNKDVLLKSFRLLYPVRDNDIEIIDFEYFIDPDAPIPKGNIGEYESIKTIDFEYLTAQINKCNIKIYKGDYDGALTSCRTILESLCKYILEMENVEISASLDLVGLYKKVTNILKMDSKLYDDGSLKKVIGGSFSIVSGIMEIRNLHSDAHGKSPTKVYTIKKRHAKFAVSTTLTIAEFIYETYKEIKEEN